MADVTTCRICGGDIEASGKGRPRTYCGTACRRMAEHEIRRLDATIGKLEDDARALRNPATLKLPTDQAHAEFISVEIADARKRLRELLTAE